MTSPTLRIDLGGSALVVDPYRAPRQGPHLDAAPPAYLATHAAIGGDARIVFEGPEPLAHPRLLEWIEGAVAQGAREVHVRTDARLLAPSDRAATLARAGVSALTLRWLASDPMGYAHVLQDPRGLAHALRGTTRALEADLPTTIEVPLLDLRVQDPSRALARLVSLKADAPSTRAVLRFAAPESAFGLEGERGLRANPLGDIARRLDVACATAADAGVDVRIVGAGGLPPCLFADLPHAAARLELPPGSRGARAGFQHDAACADCAYLPVCPGLREARARLIGTHECRPLPHRVRALDGHPERRRAPWTTARVAAARANDRRVLRLTMACNQACVFCPSNDTSENVSRDPGARRRLLARWHRAGVRRLSFSGGEPTLDRDLPGLIAVASRLGFSEIEVVTNAVLLSEPARARRLVEAGMTQATVSLHAHEARTSEGITCGRPGDFARTLAGIDNLLAAEHVRLYLNHVVHRDNAADLPAFVAFVHARFGRAPTLTFALMTPLFRAREHLRWLPRLGEIAPPLREALSRAAHLGVRVEVLARPGIPPCVLAPDHLDASDALRVAEAALSEDAPKKVKASTCPACRYDSVCAGVWRAYAEVHGTHDLVPVP